MTERLTDEALIHRAVLAWIKDDAPIGIKMQMTPDLANKLSERIARAAHADDLRPETDAEHIARDMREGRFPQRSDRLMVSAALSQKGGDA